MQQFASQNVSIIQINEVLYIYKINLNVLINIIPKQISNDFDEKLKSYNMIVLKK